MPFGPEGRKSEVVLSNALPDWSSRQKTPANQMDQFVSVGCRLELADRTLLKDLVLARSVTSAMSRPVWLPDRRTGFFTGIGLPSQELAKGTS